MKLFLVIAVVILFGACSEPENQIEDLRDPATIENESGWSDEGNSTPETIEIEVDSAKINAAKTAIKSEWSYKVTSISENNWGYQIFQKGTMVINQTTIPSVQGVDGFDSKEKAERTAKYILNKVEKGIFPPTVDKKELENLGVLRD